MCGFARACFCLDFPQAHSGVALICIVLYCILFSTSKNTQRRCVCELSGVTHSFSILVHKMLNNAFIHHAKGLSGYDIGSAGINKIPEKWEQRLWHFHAYIKSLKTAA